MRENRAQRMMEISKAYVGDAVPEPCKFERVRCRQFLRVYLWVVYVSGFRYCVVKKHFPALKAAFRNLDLDAIARIRQINVDRLPIRNKRKADWFLEGCSLIRAEGWRSFKRRLAANHRAVLRELPGIGPVTWQHMALRLGLEDTEKCDTWMMQCAAECDTTVGKLVTYLSGMYGLRRQQVDYYLWKYCSDNQKLP